MTMRICWRGIKRGKVNKCNIEAESGGEKMKVGFIITWLNELKK
jgi:hypothetical protein